MVAFPPSKINLGLHILKRRADGYHDIETCFYPIGWTDVLEIIPANELRFTTSGLAIEGKPDDNLCLKAYRLLKKEFDIPFVYIHLHKVVPMGAGLGGGSSDAAWTLRLLNSIFDLKISTDQLSKYAASLGSDCSFFVQDACMIGTGRGEVLTPSTVSLAGKFIVVAKPDVHVSTAEAYSEVVPTANRTAVDDILKLPINQWRDVLMNDFEKSVLNKYPVIEHIKDALYGMGAEYASMSGSGSAVFGIFSKPVDVKEKFSAYYSWSGMLK